MVTAYSLIPGSSPLLDLTPRRPPAKLFSSNQLRTTTSAGKNSPPRINFTQRPPQANSSPHWHLPCRVGRISRPPAGHAQKRVFVSLSADAAAATSELRLLHCPEYRGSLTSNQLLLMEGLR
ncbi:hypothetical protein J6590_094246 [Homalodisca vitripennis]|nr:hypothetical protein J6590_094246 [Homalodisca vitripennis]